ADRVQSVGRLGWRCTRPHSDANTTPCDSPERVLITFVIANKNRNAIEEGKSFHDPPQRASFVPIQARPQLEHFTSTRTSKVWITFEHCIYEACERRLMFGR